MNVAIFFRELLFSHLTPLIKLGRVRVIGENDFPPLAAHLSARTLASSRWNPNTRSPWRLILSATHSLGWRFWILYPIILWLVLLETSSPLIIRHLLTMISEGAAAMPLGEALATAIALCLVELVTALSRQHYIRLALESQLLTLNRLTTLIFDHSLRLTLTARGRLPTGDIVNHMAADADAISEVPGITGDFAYSVLIATSALIMMFAILGQAAWVVVVVLALLLPPTRLLARRFTRIDDILMRENDARVSLMTQILTGIRVIKYFAWEQLFSRRVASIRARELSARRKYVTSEIASVLVYLGTNSLVALAAFAAYWSLGGKLDAPTVFTCLALFNLLEHPFGAMAWHVSGMMAARVGARRVISFLAQPTLSPPAKPRVPSLSAIRLDNLSLAYPGQETILSDIHLEIRAGEAVAIVGPVGCGKSALIHAILGEMCPAAGRVSFDAPLSPPAIAFVPQSPWILNATLRENVLLGSTDDSSLRQILEMVGLGPDIALMPSGLLTEIGEHGINLSGGQKQRVNLARAVMTRSKIFLMDDPFSAVDHATEDHIARELIFGHLRGTTRVVTTHRLHHLGDFDRVVFLANGRMEGAAPLERLLSECPAFAAFYRDHISRLDAHSSRSQHLAMPGAEVREALSSADSSTTESRITEEEDREFGAVKGHLYVDYLLRLGGRSRLQRVATLTALFFGVALAAAGPVLHTAFLSAWMDVASQRLPTGMGQLFTR
jgi:ABC-type multidrug transport system fused ATPase/permease subunit